MSALAQGFPLGGFSCRTAVEGSFGSLLPTKLTDEGQFQIRYGFFMAKNKKQLFSTNKGKTTI
ncbi:MAG: hypothetical protein ACLTAN_04095 [Christensenellaceae bacterium]